MSLQTRLASLISAIGADVKAHETAINALEASVQIKGVYNSGSEPTGQPVGTVILVRP